MRLRTLLGILFALAVVVVASYLYNQNFDLLGRQFALTSGRSVPVYAALLGAFLLGFLPAVGVLVAQTLKHELAQRRQRKLARQAKSREGSFRRAVDFMLDGQWSRAAAELENGLIDRPEDFSTLLHYGDALRRDGRAEEALEVHRRASVLYPRSVAVLYQLAEDYQACGDTEVAEQIGDRVLRDFPGLGLRVLRRRRDERLAAGDWAEAGKLHERIESQLTESGDSAQLAAAAPIRTGLLYQRAVESLEADRVGEAQKQIAEVLEQSENHIPALILAGEAEVLAGRSKNAVEIWRNGYQSTGRPVFLLRIEDHFIERHEPLEAIENLHQIIAMAEADGLPRFFLGRLYYRLEMHEEALKVLEPLREQFESSATLHYLLGRIHQRRGEMARAAECYQSSIQRAGVSSPRFVCRRCECAYTEWHDRCERCGSWGEVELDLDVATDLSEESDDQMRAVYERAPWGSKS